MWGGVLLIVAGRRKQGEGGRGVKRKELKRRLKKRCKASMNSLRQINRRRWDDGVERRVNTDDVATGCAGTNWKSNRTRITVELTCAPEKPFPGIWVAMGSVYVCDGGGGQFFLQIRGEYIYINSGPPQTVWEDFFLLCPQFRTGQHAVCNAAVPPPPPPLCEKNGNENIFCQLGARTSFV